MFSASGVWVSSAQLLASAQTTARVCVCEGEEGWGGERWKSLTVPRPGGDGIDGIEQEGEAQMTLVQG